MNLIYTSDQKELIDAADGFFAGEHTVEYMRHLLESDTADTPLHYGTIFLSLACLGFWHQKKKMDWRRIFLSWQVLPKWLAMLP